MTPHHYHVTPTIYLALLAAEPGECQPRLAGFRRSRRAR